MRVAEGDGPGASELCFVLRVVRGVRALLYAAFVSLFVLWPVHSSPADDGGVAGLMFMNLSSELRVLRVARVEESGAKSFLAGAYDNGIWGRRRCHGCRGGIPFSQRAVTDFELWALGVAWRGLLRSASAQGCVLLRPSPSLDDERGGSWWQTRWGPRVVWNAGLLISSDCLSGVPDFKRSFDTLEAVLSLIAPKRQVELPESAAFQEGRLQVVIHTNASAEDRSPVGMILPSYEPWETAVLDSSNHEPATLHALDELEQRLLANLLAEVPRDLTDQSGLTSCCWHAVFPHFQIAQLSTGPSCGTNDHSYLAWVDGMRNLFLQVAARALHESAPDKRGF